MPFDYEPSVPSSTNLKMRRTQESYIASVALGIVQEVPYHMFMMVLTRK